MIVEVVRTAVEVRVTGPKDTLEDRADIIEAKPVVVTVWS